MASHLARALFSSALVATVAACFASVPDAYECSVEDDIACPSGFVCRNDIKKCTPACKSSGDCAGAAEACIDSGCELWAGSCDTQTPCIDDAWFCNPSGACEKYPAVVSCSNSTKDGVETDVDCGGPECQACAAGRACAATTDCVSTLCVGSICQASCTDNVRDGDETCIDGGGSCPADCAAGQGCLSGADCTSRVCGGLPLTCQEPTCFDGTENAGESCIDAGGSCPADCADGLGCASGDDCTSRVCEGDICQSPTCFDSTQNQGELAVDCGFSVCGVGCPDGSPCQVPQDCTSVVCTNLVCVPPTCGDGFTNGSETDKDCGGGCPGCLVGQACNVAGDCANLFCPQGFCEEPYATQVTAGAAHTCALLVTGQVKCWGNNGLGQLGLGDTFDRGDMDGEMGDALPRVSLGTGSTATALAAGYWHTCALLTTGEVKCWGDNGYGQLGLGDTAARGDAPGEMGDFLPPISLGTGRTATTIAAGRYHTCALLDTGQVKCWGYNGWGRLGVGDTAARGDAPGEMGSALPVVSLGADRIATAITAGDGHTCALLDTGQAKCWGENPSGQLGLGDTAARGDAPGEMGDFLPPVSLGTGRTASAIAAGPVHTCALLDTDQVKCWGYNGAGRLGVGDTASRGDSPGEMGDSLPPVSLGVDRVATAIATGGGSSCALLDTGQVKCWGDNSSGRLGLGDIASRGDTPDEMGDNLPPVALGTGRTATAVAAAPFYTCVLLDTGDIKCWGHNNYGQLGLGDTASRGDAPDEMGDSLPPVDL